MKTRSKTGTREWSEHGINICRGCSNACLYCYARARALRYGRIDDGQAWANEHILDAPTGARRATYKKLAGRIMFPTTHDITEGNLEECCELARSMIRAGNELLIVSKPSPECMFAFLGELLDEREDARELVTLRFTITSVDEETSRFWEPNAPKPSHRVAVLRHVKNSGWRTSVSMEPLLDARNVDIMVRVFSRLVTDTIWIGACRDLKRRTAWALDGTEPEYRRLQEDQTDIVICGVYEMLKDNPKIRWKDSYVQVLRPHFGGTWVGGLRMEN